MKKNLVSIFDYRELFVNLRYLRKLRYSRKEKIPFRIKRRYGRKELEEFVSKFMTKAGQSIFKPAHAKDIFPKNDHIDHEKVKVYT